MKKTLFTICSVALVCCAIIMSCTKDDNSATHVGYASQPGYGTGNNPNPNGLPYQTPTVSPTNTTTPKDTAGSISINGGSAFSLHDNGNNSIGFYGIYGKPASGSSSNPSVSITFATSSAPTSGTYTIISTFPSTGQCNFNFTDAGGNSGSAAAGTVSITAGSPNSTCGFSNIICVCGANTYTLTGTLYY
jgi:hypothetical protein